MKKSTYLPTCLITLLLAVSASSAFAAADFAINESQLDNGGQTLTTTCANTKGFYLAMGKPTLEQHAKVTGAGHGMPLELALWTFAPPSWDIHYGHHVNTRLRVAWSGPQDWTHWLQTLAYQHNLAIIVDWDQSRLYVNRL